MPNSLSNDLRERVVAFVEAGHSRRAAAAHFRVSPSAVINLMTLLLVGAVKPVLATKGVQGSKNTLLCARNFNLTAASLVTSNSRHSHLECAPL
jgi:hypothetical protein